MPMINGVHHYHTALVAKAGRSFSVRATYFWHDLLEYVPQDSELWPADLGKLHERYEMLIRSMEEGDGQAPMLEGFVDAVAVMAGVSSEDRAWLSDAFEWVVDPKGGME